MMRDHGHIGRLYSGEVIADHLGIDRVRRLGVGGRPVCRRSARLQEAHLRDALRRSERRLRRVRAVLHRRAVLGVTKSPTGSKARRQRWTPRIVQNFRFPHRLGLASRDRRQRVRRSSVAARLAAGDRPARPCSPARSSRRRWRRCGSRRRATISCAPLRSRTPPAAFTPISAPTTRRINATSAGVAPCRAKPVDVFTNVAPAALASVHAVTFSSSVSRAVSMMTLLTTEAARQASATASMSSLHGTHVARLQGADVDHHVHFRGAIEDHPARLVLLDVGRRRPEREAHDRADAHRDCLAAGAPRAAPRSGSGRRSRTSTRGLHGTKSRSRPASHRA